MVRFVSCVDSSEAETGADDAHNQLVEDDDEEVKLRLACSSGEPPACHLSGVTR